MQKSSKRAYKIREVWTIDVFFQRLAAGSGFRDTYIVFLIKKKGKRLILMHFKGHLPILCDIDSIGIVKVTES